MQKLAGIKMCAKHSVKVLVEAVVVIMAFSGLCVNYVSIFFSMASYKLGLWLKELHVKDFLEGKGELNAVDDTCMFCPSNMHV